MRRKERNLRKNDEKLKVLEMVVMEILERERESLERESTKK